MSPPATAPTATDNCAGPVSEQQMIHDLFTQGTFIYIGHSLMVMVIHQPQTKPW